MWMESTPLLVFVEWVSEECYVNKVRIHELISKKLVVVI